MYYKIDHNHPLYQKIQDIQLKMQEVNKERNKLLEEYDCDQFLQPVGVVAGGISGFVFKEKPEGWKAAGFGQGTFMPRKIKANEELIARIKALPVVKKTDIKRLIKYEGYPWSMPGIQWKKSNVLIEITKEGYQPVEGMIEILYSEYKELSREVNPKD